ncbi:reverse transcriptase domain-containing protein [Tanacetum coccineum]
MEMMMIMEMEEMEIMVTIMGMEIEMEVKEEMHKSLRLVPTRIFSIVNHAINCPPNSQVKFATCTLLDEALTWWNSYVQTIGIDEAYELPWKDLVKLMIDVYCPRNKIQKLENEFWNLCIKETDVASYTRRFLELTLLCSRMVPKENDKIKRFIWGLPNNIKGNVTSSKPVRLQDAIRMANGLMDQKVCVCAARNAKQKRKFNNNPRGNRVQQPPFKRQNVAQAFTMGNNEKRGYARSAPYYNKCRLHHEGPCTVKCTNCKKVGHMVRDCKTVVAAQTLRAPMANQRVVTCFGCGGSVGNPIGYEHRLSPVNGWVGIDIYPWWNFCTTTVIKLASRQHRSRHCMVIIQIKSHIQAARDRQKSYADKRSKPLDFQVEDKVMLKVSPWKGVIHFGKRGKLYPCYIGPFKILAKVGTVAYCLEL